MVVRQICKQVLFMRHLKKSVTDKVTLFYCYFDSEHPRCTWVVVGSLRRLESAISMFQYPRCTWVVVAKSAQKQFLYALILSQCAAFVKCFFPINFRFFILFFCSICFSSDFLVRIPLFHPSNRCENRDFRVIIFLYYFLI